MRRAAVPLPPEEIWLGEPWEEPPAPRRRSRSTGATAPLPPRYRRLEREEPLDAPPARLDTPPARLDTPAARLDRPPARAAEPAAPPAERRTVTIRGRGAERDLAWTAAQSRRRENRPIHERPGFRPDRAALWAVVLGLLLVLVAATSSHAAVRAPHAAAARTRDGAAPAARVMVLPAAPAVRAPAVLRHRA